MSKVDEEKFYTRKTKTNGIITLTIIQHEKLRKDCLEAIRRLKKL